MKIKTILIENFKGIEKLRYDFKSTTVGLVAENGKGKTAFREAFFAAITGEFPENCIQTGKDFIPYCCNCSSSSYFAGYSTTSWYVNAW
jgi:DNA repair exonuclease SbcCD ATPase subunit